MPLVAIIPSAIPAQNFELVRARIVEIIGVEMAAQHVINSSQPLIKRVWEERCVTINTETECPCINVSVHKDDFDNETVLKTIGTVIFNIDIYATSPTTTAAGGDELAMKLTFKIAGMIRAILAYPDYNTLAFNPGIIQQTCTERVFIIDKSRVQDALSTVGGRLQFKVMCYETTDFVNAGATINELTTTILLSDDKGFFYDYKQQPITPTITGATLTNSFFSNPILEITIGGTTYYDEVDFTKSGTTITASTFTFTNGVQIIAKTN